MAFYKYHEPAQWNGYRDIDEEIDIDKINMENNFEGNDVESANADEDGATSTIDVGKKLSNKGEVGPTSSQNQKEEKKRK